ncbi:riboflavin synthase [Actinomyces oricola]|uniref:riboflavin synthase n=1 Tax=Actinomyces oricola TaxID=206043 RepID=UPI000FFF0B02|nr:riboflavin synthase [Actinomyces oricola]
MFTGIIAGTGTVLAIEPQIRPGVTRLTLECGSVTSDLAPGDSLAVNGVCLTSTTRAEACPDVFVAELMGETLDRTSLGRLALGGRVNLERCVPLGGRLDGHIVQGHVDATGRVVALEPQGSWTRMRVSMPHALAGQVALKGSIAVDGVSLTVTAVSAPYAPASWFEVGLIPETLAKTTLGMAKIGDIVNLETDVIAKYLERLVSVGAAPKNALEAVSA